MAFDSVPICSGTSADIAREGRAAAVADDADAMGVVRHQPGIVLACKAAEFGQRCEIAIHGKYAVSEDHGLGVAGAMTGEERPQAGNVVVSETHDGGAGKPRSGVTARMGQLVDRHEVAVADP